jgi:hypothetical protein
MSLAAIQEIEVKLSAEDSQRRRLRDCVAEVTELLGEARNADQTACRMAFRRGDRTTVEAYAFRFSDDPYYSCLNYLLGALAGGPRALTVLREATLKASDHRHQLMLRESLEIMDQILNGDVL